MIYGIWATYDQCGTLEAPCCSKIWVDKSRKIHHVTLEADPRLKEAEFGGHSVLCPDGAWPVVFGKWVRILLPAMPEAQEPNKCADLSPSLDLSALTPQLWNFFSVVKQQKNQHIPYKTGRKYSWIFIFWQKNLVRGYLITNSPLCVLLVPVWSSYSRSTLMWFSERNFALESLFTSMREANMLVNGSHFMSVRAFHFAHGGL